MMLYLTGASASLAKSPENPQSDPNRSLGGYIASTPVPNAAINSLFDLISSLTIERKYKETMALGLVNKLSQPVNNVTLKIISNDENIAEFKIAAIDVSKDNYCMESIDNRYQEPMQVDFFNADFYRAAIDFDIITPAIAGEEIVLYPFDIDITVVTSGIEGTWDAFYNALYNNNEYSVKRLSEYKFRIERRDEQVIAVPFACSFITSDNFSLSFNGLFQNKSDNSVVLKDANTTMLPGEAIGIWIQRIIKSDRCKTNDELISEYTLKTILANIEEVEMIISYDLVEAQNYSTDYAPNSYS